MALIHNALRRGKVRFRPVLTGEQGREIFVPLSRSCVGWGLLGEVVPTPVGTRLVFCLGCPLCLISLLLKETKLGDR